MVVKIPQNAIENTFLLDNLYKERPSLGIILEDMDCSQFAFEALHECHRYLEKTNRVEFLFFCQNWKQPCVVPPTALYHMTELFAYRGNVISASINSVIDALRIKTIKKIIWYIYDITEISSYDTDLVKSLVVNDNITKVFRSNEYINVFNQIVQDNKNNYPVMDRVDLEFCVELLYGKNYVQSKRS